MNGRHILDTPPPPGPMYLNFMQFWEKIGQRSQHYSKMRTDRLSIVWRGEGGWLSVPMHAPKNAFPSNHACPPTMHAPQPRILP